MSDHTKKLAQTLVMRALMDRGVPDAKARELAESGSYTMVEGDVLVDIGGKRALLDQPDTVTALAVHVAKQSTVISSLAYDPVAAGKAAAAAQRPKVDPLALR